MMRLPVLFLTVLIGGAIARAEADNPRRAWEQAVGELATALCGEDVATTARRVDGAVLRAFNSSARAKLVDLFDQCAAGMPVMARGYEGIPSQAASDMAAAFADADLPDAIKRRFTFTSAASAREADEIAQQWIGDALHADDRELVGLIVLWRGNQALPSLADSYSRDIVFVLVSGEIKDGTCRLNQVVFGNPLRAAD